MSDKSVAIKDKFLLTVDEASQYFNIGQNKLRVLCEGHPSFVLMKGSHMLIKREQLEKILLESETI